MPDVHLGIGATVGSVIPTLRAIIPAAVGVDIGCGMMAAAHHAARERPARQPGAAALRASSAPCRTAAPTHGGRDRGRWEHAARRGRRRPGRRWCDEFDAHRARQHPRSRTRTTASTSARSGTGNHFIEVCLDEDGPRVGHAALGLARRRQPHRHPLHRAGEEGCASCTSATCRTRTSRTSRKARSTSTTTCAAVGWAQKFARAQPRADDGQP